MLMKHSRHVEEYMSKYREIYELSDILDEDIALEDEEEGAGFE